MSRLHTLSFLLCLLIPFSTPLPTPFHHRPPQGPQPSFQASGCGITHNPGYNYQFPSGQNYSIISGTPAIRRYYSVQVPPAYEPQHAYPLIFDYHGNTDTSTDQRNNSVYFNYTAGHDYLVVYPQGYNRSWEGPKYAIPGIDDLQFTSDLLAHIEENFCIDSDRVYASGKSNGAGFVDTLACSDNGDAFAAFAMASAALYTDLNETSCTKKRAILESHGDIDTVVPYLGRNCSSTNLTTSEESSCIKSGSEPDIDSWISWWGERDCGPNAQPHYITNDTGYNITEYSCGEWENVVTHYQIYDLGHCWPGIWGDNYDAQAYPTQNCSTDRVLDYTEKVLEWFGRWDLGSAPGN